MLAAAVSAAAAGEPWLTKPYQSWDKKDVRKILTDSPWAQTVQTIAPWQNGFAGRSGRGPTTPNYPSGPMSSDPSQSAPGMPSAATLASGYVPVVIRWASSATERAAVAQQQMLRGVMTPAQVDSAVAQQPEEYEIVAVFDANPGLPPITEDQLEAAASLKLKPSGREVEAIRVKIREAEKGSGGEVSFYFPKRDANGEPLISPVQSEAQFECQAGRMSLRANFQLQKMRTKDGLDL